jgi:hypothetical protein
MEMSALAAALKGQTASTEKRECQVGVKFQLDEKTTLSGYVKVNATTPDEYLEEVAKLAAEGWPVNVWIDYKKEKSTKEFWKK